MLLDRGATIPIPHDVKCSCDDCVIGSADDSLKFSLARINAYRSADLFFSYNNGSSPIKDTTICSVLTYVSRLIESYFVQYLPTAYNLAL